MLPRSLLRCGDTAANANANANANASDIAIIHDHVFVLRVSSFFPTFIFNVLYSANHVNVYQQSRFTLFLL